MHKYIFLDTNIFEQVQPIENIDWLTLTRSEEVTLVVPTMPLRQLNKHKDRSERGRIKRRAAAALSQLSGYSRQNCTFPRSKVDLEFRHQEPLIDFAMYHLSKDVADDWLLASAIEFAREKNFSPEDVMIATDDLGLELKVKGQPALSILTLPAHLRLLDEADPEEARIKELESENRRLKSSLPRLNLAFSNKSSSLEITIESPVELPEDKIKEGLAQLRCKYPLLTPESFAAPSVLSALISPQDVSAYNMELLSFFKKTEDYYLEMVQYVNRSRLTVKLGLVLQNTGNAPADDIDAELHFPDGTSVLEDDAQDVEPKRPKPPLTPQEKFTRQFQFPSGLALAHIATPHFDIPDFTPRTPANTRLKGIRKTNSYLVSFAVDRLKHTTFEELPSVRFRFDSFETVKPFQIDYTLLAANLPLPATGALNILASVS